MSARAVRVGVSMVVWAGAVAGVAMVGAPAPLVVAIAILGTIGILGFPG